MAVSSDGTIKHEQYWEFEYPDKVSPVRDHNLGWEGLIDTLVHRHKSRRAPWKR